MTTPRLYLFLSVDIIDSTAKKYNTKSPIDWYSVFTDFYVSFPDEFKIHMEAEYNYRGGLQYSTDKLVVWKHAGDEILFYVEITQEDEIPCIVSAFKKTLEDWYTPAEKLDVKGCIWTGQVPFIDRRIQTTEDSNYDFIGPSIDCGFRLGKYASKNEIAISVEIAALLNGTSWLQSSLFYLKSENLKGVLGTKKYPIFILKLDNAKTDEYDYLNSPCRPTDLNEYITKYYEEMTKEFPGKVSRIEKDIPAYLAGKKKLCEKIIISRTSELQDAQEIDSDKQGDTTAFEQLESLASESGEKPLKK